MFPPPRPWRQALPARAAPVSRGGDATSPSQSLAGVRRLRHGGGRRLAPPPARLAWRRAAAMGMAKRPRWRRAPPRRWRCSTMRRRRRQSQPTPRRRASVRKRKRPSAKPACLCLAPRPRRRASAVWWRPAGWSPPPWACAACNRWTRRCPTYVLGSAWGLDGGGTWVADGGAGPGPISLCVGLSRRRVWLAH